MNVNPKYLLAVLALGLIVVGIQTRVCGSGGKEKDTRRDPAPVAVPVPPKEPQAAKESVPTEFWNVSAIGVTPEKTRAVAEEKARQKVLEYFHRQDPPITWEPSLEFLKSHSFVRETKPMGDKPDDDGNYECELRVDLSNQLIQAILQGERDSLKSERQLLTAKVFGVLLALVLAVGGYFYLDEATKGYYTVLLRLAALTLVGAVGLVIWLALN